MKTVAIYQSVTQAEALVETLQAEGIQATILGGYQVGITGGGVRVFVVDDADYEKAKGVLALLEGTTTTEAGVPQPHTSGPRPEPANSEALVKACPSCGAESPAHFAVCWRCQANLGGVAPTAPHSAVRAESSPHAGREPRLSGRARRLLTLELVITQIAFWGWRVPTLVWRHMETSASPRTAPQVVVLSQLGSVLFEGAAAALLLYLLWTSFRSLEPAGLASITWWKEFLWSIPLLVAGAGLWYVGNVITAVTGLPHWNSDSSLVPGGPTWHIWLFVGIVGEEVCFRAYLISRLRQLFGTAPWAITISAALFAVSHGASPAFTFGAFLYGVLLGATFVASRRLPRLVLSHWAWDLLVTYRIAP